MRIIDAVLNKVTMYRLTLYYLIGLIVIAVIFSALGILPYNASDIIIDTGIAVIIGVFSNYIFAKFFKAVTNVESVFITALILVLIIPIKFPINVAFLAIVVVGAMASKYILTIEKRHLFNPAAVAVAGISLISDHSATWWVGTPVLLPFVIIGGLLLARKIQRGTLIVTFLFAYLLLIAIGAIYHGGGIAAIVLNWQLGMEHSALFFFAFVMLTEPLTSPPTKHLQKYYAFIVAIFYTTPQLRLLSLGLTPEIALCIGNVFSYIVSPKYRFVLPLKWKKEVATTILFGFEPMGKFAFKPGQYMEWTLPHANIDNRGNRRYFSIASSPTEKDIMIVVKFYEPSSSYKKELRTMGNDKEIIAAQLAGDFTLPDDLNTPLVFVAGGVGIAPFRSMIQYIVDTKRMCNIVLLYANRNVDEILFTDVFKQAEQYGVKTIYSLTDVNSIPQDWLGERGYITEAMIQKNIVDYARRVFYISGPQLMVESFEEILRNMEIKNNNIRLDYFPGYNDK